MKLTMSIINSLILILILATILRIKSQIHEIGVTIEGKNLIEYYLNDDGYFEKGAKPNEQE